MFKLRTRFEYFSTNELLKKVRWQATSQLALEEQEKVSRGALGISFVSGYGSRAGISIIDAPLQSGAGFSIE